MVQAAFTGFSEISLATHDWTINYLALSLFEKEVEPIRKLLVRLVRHPKGQENKTKKK